MAVLDVGKGPETVDFQLVYVIVRIERFKTVKAAWGVGFGAARRKLYRDSVITPPMDYSELALVRYRGYTSTENGGRNW